MKYVLMLLLGPMLVQGVEITSDRLSRYKSVDGIELRLHVFEPEGLHPSDHRPGIIFFFGGGWAGGTPRQFYPQARAMADLGMVAFSAEYRVKSRHNTSPFACVNDGKSAVRWVREHAAELGVDPDRIAAAGGSAGGHVAVCTGLIDGCEEVGENPAISCAPNALILFNPVLDTTENGYGAGRFEPEQQTDLSPCHQVKRGVAPTLIFHGTQDKTVPFENALRFTRLMNEAGNECRLVPFEGRGHGFFNGSRFRPANGDEDYAETLKQSVAFLAAKGWLDVQPGTGTLNRYDGSWEALQKMPVPAWFDDGKIGIFIHWGPYSVIGYRKEGRGYAEHVPRIIYQDTESYYPYLNERWGAHPPEFGYKDVIPEFTAENWNPDEWAALFKEVGARYVVLTAEHHDGWANWDSDLTPWNAVDRGPKRDLVGDLGKAVRRQGLKYAPSYHRERHTGFFGTRETMFQVYSEPSADVVAEIERIPDAASLYGPFGMDQAFVDDYVARWKEIQRKYHPDFLWIDDVPVFTRDGNHPDTGFKPEIQYFYDQCRQMITDFMNAGAERGQEVYVNNKGRNRNWPDGVGCLEKDNLKLKVVGPKWQSCTTFGTSYGYLEYEEDPTYPHRKKSVEQVIHEMVEVVSRNGNFLINVSPKADGTIPSWQVERLRAMGEWLKINGDAIYGTRYWKADSQENEHLSFTTRGKTLYAVKRVEPTAPFTLHATAGWKPHQVKSVTLLGSTDSVGWKMTPAGLEIAPPVDLGVSRYAWSFEIVTDEVQSPPHSMMSSASVALPLPGSMMLSSMAITTDMYVSPAGKDTNSGTKDAPLASLSAARDAVRPHAGKRPVTVHVADGVYYLAETLVFTEEDSGTAEHPVVYRAVHEGGAVLSGGSKLQLKWTPYRDGIFKAMTPNGLEIDQLFINGKNQRMARYPDYDADRPTLAYQGFAADAFSKERAAKWNDPTGGYIHAMHRSRWGGYHYRITGKNEDGDIAYEGGWQNNRRSGMHKDLRMVENIFEELDAPHEWFHNAETGTLYYMPDAQVDLSRASVEVVRLRHLIEFRGSPKRPVQFVTLQGFTVRHAARTFMETNEPLLRSDWAMYRGGAVVLTGTEDVAIRDCEFDQVGGNAIFVNNYNRRTLVKGCHIHDAGASGVCFVGDPHAVRDPLFEYGEKNDLNTIDRTVGPKTDNYPMLGVVEDCLIHGIGRVERQPAGVLIDMAMKITVRDTSVYDCARAGINIGDGCWGGHLIEGCDVFDTVLETHDHGSFNSWGRDRFWHSDRSESQRVVDQEPDLPFLDAMYTTIIRNNRWRCDHGWDIDLDDGSSNYDITNNLMLNGGLKFREGFRRRAWNNVMVNNGFHPHVWYANSGDEFFGNIVMRAPRGVRVPTDTATGKRVDSNLFFTGHPEGKDRYAVSGWDVNSINGDPMFVDPAGGDFRVKDGSPALEIGFKNFPMDHFGVKKASLRAIAETPKVSALTFEKVKVQTEPLAMPTGFFWLGARLHGLEGEEFSAFGTQKEEGGVALMDVPAGSPAAQAGFMEGDLIQGLNGQQTKNVADLLTAYTAAGNAPLKVRAVRRQQTKIITLDDSPVVEVEAGGLPVPTAGKVTANQKTHNDPLAILVDGTLTKGYGPVFGNGTMGGAYKLDLGELISVSAITSWSYNQGGTRGPQIVTLYGSSSAQDPGWDLLDSSKFVPIGSFDTTRLAKTEFARATLRAGASGRLGNFRWIVWQGFPVTGKMENTAFQELSVTEEQEVRTQ